MADKREFEDRSNSKAKKTRRVIEKSMIDSVSNENAPDTCNYCLDNIFEIICDRW